MKRFFLKYKFSITFLILGLIFLTKDLIQFKNHPEWSLDPKIFWLKFLIFLGISLIFLIIANSKNKF